MANLMRAVVLILTSVLSASSTSNRAPITIKLGHFRYFDDAYLSDSLVVLTKDVPDSYGSAYLGPAIGGSLGITSGAHVALTFTVKIGGSPIADSGVNYLPSRRRLSEKENQSRRLSSCSGRGFAVQMANNDNCLAYDDGLSACGGFGFFFITENSGAYSPGLYSVMDGVILDSISSTALFAGGITQVKITFGPGSGGNTDVQLYLDGSPVLSPISYDPLHNKDGAAIVFTAKTTPTCHEEHIVSNMKVTSDQDLPDDYEGLLKAYLSNPNFMDDLTHLAGDEIQVRQHASEHHAESSLGMYAAALTTLVVASGLVVVVVKMILFKSRFHATKAGGDVALSMQDMHLAGDI
eukprot:CAMPEP_0113952528 /NCGR_PEP_ID=MMETSP1339-20121228/90474_1 /TAXON_ID=94617 /ORGANISM="Fibrocapsa japonica" /LENGTH=350 /DNA_ID=CAMNT_0000961161 /DNA_START=78 /DNA_END=1130 /DNA_ORIENTATION=+ /assembly_acc=CAM_ASM_000762